MTLNEVEVRVLGSLIEKEITTPDYYPLSLNALTNACNQTSNRHPVVHYDEATVEQALDSLREKNLVHLIDRGDSRVKKYRHVLYESLNFGRQEIAVMYVLMVRGPQTVGEIKTRAGRTYDFASLEAVDMTLNTLMTRQPPLVMRLPRQTGQKEVRYAHLLSGEVHVEESEVSIAPTPVQSVDRVTHLEELTAELRREVDDLKTQLEQFRKQFE
jgi:uncharacterized protein YceH (UPF0502 family)